MRRRDTVSFVDLKVLLGIFVSWANKSLVGTAWKKSHYPVLWGLLSLETTALLPVCQKHHCPAAGCCGPTNVPASIVAAQCKRPPVTSKVEQSQHSLPHVGVTLGNKSAAFLACEPWSHRLCLGPEIKVRNPFQSFTVISLTHYERHPKQSIYIKYREQVALHLRKN